MKKYLIPVMVAFGLAGCTDQPGDLPPENGFTLVKSRQEIVSKIAGRKLSRNGEVTVVLGADGSIAGDFNGEPIRGTWDFKGGKYCSKALLGSTQLPYDCTPVWYSENQFRIGSRRTRDVIVIYQIGEKI